jgi:hypothetical protein
MGKYIAPLMGRTQGREGAIFLKRNNAFGATVIRGPYHLDHPDKCKAVFLKA